MEKVGGRAVAAKGASGMRAFRPGIGLRGVVGGCFGGFGCGLVL